MPNLTVKRSFPYARVGKSRRKSYRRRRYRRRSTFRSIRPLTTSGQRFGGFPKVAMTTLRYVDNLPSFNPGVSTVDAYFFSCNGCFDPNTSGVGGQPMGWDQWTTIYNHYVVVRSRILVIFNTDDTDATKFHVYGITIDDSGSLTDNTTTSMMSKGQSRFVTAPGSSAATGRTYQVSMGFNARRHFGRTNIQDNDQDLGAAVSANPSEQAYYCLWAGALDGGDPTVTHATAIIEYTVIFSEPKEVPIS